MKSHREPYRIVPMSKARRLITDIGRVSQNKHVIRGLMEIDVTRPRQLIRQNRERTGETISFTAYLTACAGRAVDKNKYLHAYRHWTGRLVLYENVDIATMIEIKKDGKSFPIGHIVRASNQKTVRQIHEEIREIQTRPLKEKETNRLYAISILPGFIRRFLLRLMDYSPRLIKQYKGTVVLTSVGMFGKSGGWGVSLPSHTLGITIGGIAEKPGVIEGRIEPREYLSVTLDFDHDIVDGAPAARFAQHFQEFVESGHGLNPDER